MSQVKITRPGEHPGISQINDYVFVDGVIITSKDVGDKYASILCRFYGCTAEDLVGDPVAESNPADPSLTVSNTRDGVADDSSEDGEQEEEA